MSSEKINLPPEGKSGVFLRIFNSRGIVIDHVDHVERVLCLWGLFKPVLDEFGWTRAIISGAFSLASIVNGLLTVAVGGLHRSSMVLGW